MNGAGDMILYAIGFIAISIIAIRLNIKYYKLKGDPKDFVTRIDK